MKKLLMIFFGCLSIVGCNESSKIQKTGLSPCFTESSNIIKAQFNADSYNKY